MTYLEVAIRLPVDAAESLAWALTEWGLPGLVMEERKPDEPAKKQATLKAYLPEVSPDLSLENLRQFLISALGTDTPFDLEARSLPEEDWATSWQQYWHVQRIGERLVIRPSWEPYEPQPQDLVITLDPKQAFGTGTHPTTRLCLRAIERMAAAGPLGTVYDVGAGSGILSIAALLLGAPTALAVDTDPVAVASAEENAQLNHVSDRMRNQVGSADGLPGQAEIVFANILAEVIISLASELYAHTATGGALIASGIIARKADEVARVLEEVGFRIVDRESEGEWIGLLARR